MIGGVDVSSFAVDFVFLDTEVPRWERVSLGKDGDAFDRSRKVDHNCRRHFSPTDGHSLTWLMMECEAIGIEEPRGFNPGPAFRVQGGVLQCIPAGTLVQPWVPSQWRKAVGLKGNATKSDIAAHVHGIFGDLVADWPQDACDAWCIAEATRLAVSA